MLLQTIPKLSTRGKVFETNPALKSCELIEIALLEEHAIKQSPSRIEELVKIFLGGVRLETGFWDMGHAGQY